MKRSEMVNLIAKAFEYARWVDADNMDHYHADHLLLELEQTGMLPPAWMKPIEIVDGKQYPLVPGDFKDDNGIWCTPGYHGWETE